MTGDVELELRATVAAYERVLDDLALARGGGMAVTVTIAELNRRVAAHRNKLAELESRDAID